MPLICTKCTRANPADAQYCYYDGVALAGATAGPVSIGARSFTAPFTLPGGKPCRNFDQLALGCQEDWTGAVESLRQGYLEKFMAGQGRADLAMAAREAARYPDKDRGLDQFLAKLPSQAVKPPKLFVEPTELNLGQVPIGSTRALSLRMRNQGMRLIYGSVTVENAPWLTLGPGVGANQKLFQFGDELTLPVSVQGKRLRASNKPLEGKLIVDSNAGRFSIPVTAEVPVKPFPSGCLAGARSPRQVAEKAKANPKDAAPLFEKGVVAHWYRDNGWTYPVKGASASGLGAVQQFFEALGLTPPPKVEISDKQVALKGEPGAQLRHTLEIKAQEKRPVYAHASADQPWLEVGRARLSGRVATIPITVANVPAREGETLKAKVMVTANGNQRFVIPVTLTIGGAFNLLPPIPAGGAAPVILNTRASRKRGSGLSLVPLLLLLIGLFGALTWDLMAKPPDMVIGEEGGGPGGGEEIIAGEADQPYDKEPRIAVQFTEDTQRFGLSVLKLRDPLYPDKPKLLTRHPRGNTNNTVVRIDGYEYVYGVEEAGVGIKWKFERGKGIQREVRSKEGRKVVSTMRYENERIEVTQTVELIVGQNTRVYDTVLVKYQIVNNDDKIHTVGLRAMIDTFIGLNDGPPFLIPPTDDNPQPQLVETMIRLSKAKVPQFVRVLENDKITDPNTTVAEMGLKLRGYEDINEMVICQWPQEWGANMARWDWPFEPMNKDFDKGRPKDSCVVLYWSKLNMNPKERRTMGYTYGLGRVADPEPPGTTQISKGKIRLDLRPALVKTPFVATATVKKADGQNCTLKLPPGISFVPGESPAKPVQTAPGMDYAVVSWRLIAQSKGDYIVEAALDEGATSRAKVHVDPDSIFR
jgi:hypothetical protein